MIKRADLHYFITREALHLKIAYRNRTGSKMDTLCLQNVVCGNCYGLKGIRTKIVLPNKIVKKVTDGIRFLSEPVLFNVLFIEVNALLYSHELPIHRPPYY